MYCNMSQGYLLTFEYMCDAKLYNLSRLSSLMRLVRAAAARAKTVMLNTIISGFSPRRAFREVQV